MSSKQKARILTEGDIDKIVIAQADENAAWGKPIKVYKHSQQQSPHYEILGVAQDHRREKVKRQKGKGT
jgi:hypothetical protein